MLRIRQFTDDDIPLGMRLKTQAGWNQLEGDWRRSLRLEPEGGFVAELDGAAIGTVFAWTFGPVAWIGMMLVDAEQRGRGVGRALMERALGWCDARRVRSVRLDATPLGQPLYEKLGFRAQFELTRYGGSVAESFAEQAPRDAPYRIEPFEPRMFRGLAALDLAVTRTDRSRMLLALLEENAESARVVHAGEAVAGFVLERPGALARLVGPCLAISETVGAALLRDALPRHAGQSILIDIAQPHIAARRIAAAAGLAPLRPLMRMTRGELVLEDLEYLWASSGPEKG